MTPQRPLVTCLLLSAAVFAAGAPASAAPRAVSPNVAWMLAELGLDAVPEGETVLQTGSGNARVTYAEAFRLMDERTRDLDLAALAAAARPPPAGESMAYPTVSAGDVWVIEIDQETCPLVNMDPDTRAPETDAVPHMSLYGGAFGNAHSEATGFIYDYTGGNAANYNKRMLAYGFLDPACFTVAECPLGGCHVFFMRMNGAVYSEYAYEQPSWR